MDECVQVKRDQTQQPPSSSLPDDLPPDVEDMIRHVRYSVPKKMLQCKVIETRCGVRHLNTHQLNRVLQI